MKYPIANKQNLKKYSKDLLGNIYTVEKEKELLKCETLTDFNKVLEGFGIESVASISHKHDFEYVNMGDSYNYTICDYKGRLRITTWGDIVENNMDDFE